MKKKLQINIILNFYITNIKVLKSMLKSVKINLNWNLITKEEQMKAVAVNLVLVTINLNESVILPIIITIIYYYY